MSLPSHVFREYDIRGFVDQNFTEPALAQIGRAFGTLLAGRRGPQVGGSAGSGQGPGTLAVGRDVRLSSPRYARALIAGLRSTGADVVDVGQVPTPLVYFAVNHLRTDGGAAVTASHNPPEYNGLKIVIGGNALYGEEIRNLRQMIAGGKLASGRGRRSRADVLEAYVERVAAMKPTPWLGVVERVMIYGYLLWVAVFAIALTRTTSRSPARRCACSRSAGWRTGRHRPYPGHSHAKIRPVTTPLIRPSRMPASLA